MGSALDFLILTNNRIATINRNLYVAPDPVSMGHPDPSFVESERGAGFPGAPQCGRNPAASSSPSPGACRPGTRAAAKRGELAALEDQDEQDGARLSIGAVVIGRNEGARLKACLASLRGEAERVVYVDSGSTDGSLETARAMGAEVLALDLSTPFTAARARNAGFEALLAEGPADFVQFVDGDCTVAPGWIMAGAGALAGDPRLGLATGWRSEIRPEASVYNAMLQVDWSRPAGPIETCGGDMMVRTEAFRQVGGFNPTVIAAEDDEFCLRLGDAGWKLRRLPLPMTRHDANLMRFGPWWRRTIRDGHAFAQVGWMRPSHFRRERLRAWIYGLALPLAFLLGLVVLPWLSALIAAVYGLAYARTALGLTRRGIAPAMALKQSIFLTISKVSNVIGIITYHIRRIRHDRITLIEYK